MGDRGTCQKFIVTWDFPKKPPGTFYRVMISEFGTSHGGGDYELIQRSVAVCRDDFIASRLAALADHFGAKVECLAVQREALSSEAQSEARAFVNRILDQRLHRRGRRRTKK